MEPTLLVVQLASQGHVLVRNLMPRLARLWRVVVQVLKRHDVGTARCYQNCRPLKILRQLLMWQVEEEGEGEGETTTTSFSSPPPPLHVFNLQCALDAGFIRVVEKLLRKSAIMMNTTASIINHLLRLPRMWPTMVAHGSLTEVASLVVTLRRVMQKTLLQQDSRVCRDLIICCIATMLEVGVLLYKRSSVDALDNRCVCACVRMCHHSVPY
jgi:hypothetical protein